MNIIFDENFLSADVPIGTDEDKRIILEKMLRNAVEELEANPDDQNAKDIFLTAFIGYCYYLQAVNRLTSEQTKSETLKLATEFRQAHAERRDPANTHPLIEIEKLDSSR